MRRSLTEQEANAVYSILVEECGASRRPEEKLSFMFYMTDDGHPLKEWRFQGSLGFGGKCRINSNHEHPYVDCYPEDETPARRRAIDRANARLAAMFEAEQERIAQ